MDQVFLISSGLQSYSGSGTPVNFSYNIGRQNKACWESGSSDNGKIVCDQTSMRTWTRVLISVNNPNLYELTYKGNWQNGPWKKIPETVPANGRRIFLLNDNDRAGIYFSIKELYSNIIIFQLILKLVPPC